DDLAGGGIAEGGAAVATGAHALVDGKNLQPGARGVKVGHVKRVTVTESGGVESGAVVVESHGSVDDFLPPVAIHVGNGELVIPLPRVGSVVVGKEGPALGQRPIAPIPCDDVGLGVVAARHDE